MRDSTLVSGADAVSVLTTLLRGEDDRWPLFLLGAGASFRSGVPTAADAVKQIARIVYSERKLFGARPPERVRPTEWESWLREQAWFISDPDRLAENFPALVENLLIPAEFRKRVHPITLSFAKKVGILMAELPEDQIPNPSYRFYM